MHGAHVLCTRLSFHGLGEKAHLKGHLLFGVIGDGPEPGPSHYCVPDPRPVSCSVPQQGCYSERVLRENQVPAIILSTLFSLFFKISNVSNFIQNHQKLEGAKIYVQVKRYTKCGESIQLNDVQ